MGSDKPIVESLSPNNINQEEALENQFKGMSNIPFTYADYKQTRESIIKKVNDILTNTDKEFLVSFEDGTPQWEKCCAGDLSQYPSVQWKRPLKSKICIKQKYRNLLKLRYLRIFEVFLNSFYRVLNAEREGLRLLYKIIKHYYQK